MPSVSGGDFLTGIKLFFSSYFLNLPRLPVVTMTDV